MRLKQTIYFYHSLFCYPYFLVKIIFFFDISNFSTLQNAPKYWLKITVTHFSPPQIF